MDEFARMMSMEGVRPLDQSKQKPSRASAQPRTIPSPSVVAPPTTAPVGYAWVTGPRARTALETALEPRQRVSHWTAWMGNWHLSGWQDSHVACFVRSGSPAGHRRSSIAAPYDRWRRRLDLRHASADGGRDAR